jgi:prophage tail gpP-like protein
MTDPITLPVTLMVNGVLWTGWEHVSITQSMESFAPKWSLGITLPPDQVPTSVVCPGAPCSLGYDGVLALSGWVDGVNVSITTDSHTLSLGGKGACGDLVDCHVLPPWEYTNLKLDELVRRLAKPFGLGVTVETDVGIAFPRFSISPGETVFSAISRAAKLRAVLPNSSAEGGIVLTRAGAGGRAPTGLALPGNILRGSATFSIQDQHSETHALGQREGQHEGSAAQAAAPAAVVTDGSITRYRPRVLLAEQQADGQTLEMRAAWQQAATRAKGTRATVAVQGWRAGPGGPLWRPNWLVACTAPTLGLSGDFLIVEVERTLGPGGTVTQLTLCPPDAYQTEPKTDDPGKVQQS